jgi:uncharacterized protein (DUF849 family)
MTTREELDRIRTEVFTSPDIHPADAAIHLNSLAALIGNLADKVAERQMAYNRVLHDAYEMESKANRAKILAEISPEYQALLESKAAERTATELMRALKYYIRVRQEEFEASKHL